MNPDPAADPKRDFYANDEIEIAEEMPPPVNPSSSGYARDRGSSEVTSAIKEVDSRGDGDLSDDWVRGKIDLDENLTAQVSAETDPVALLPKVVALLYLQVYNKALQAPGRAISAAISHLKDKVPESTYKILMDYHRATVTLLALQAAATGDEEDCTADRILSKMELLESKMPELKALVLSSSSC